jgi:CheY-like chemotaxis protein
MANEHTAHTPDGTSKPPVLIVDDDADIRDFVRGVLHEAGYQTLEAGDGVAALETLQTHMEPLVVLLDILLPQLDGAALLGIVARNHHMAVSNAYVLMTGKPIVAFPVLRRLAVELDALILSKPIDTTSLLDAVTRAATRLAATHLSRSPSQQSQLGK